MKKLIAILPLLIIGAIANAQFAYDSLTNIPPKKISTLYGQTATIVELNELYPEKTWSNQLKNGSLISKKYTIVKAEKDTKRPQVWVTLAAASDTIYYRLTMSNMKKAPFIVGGFWQKQEKLFLDQKLRLKINDDYTEVNTGKVKEFTTSDTFTCTGLSFVKAAEEIVPSYVLTNTAGETINIPLKGFETVATNTIDRFVVL